ncbi:hypothetical protein [Spirosoma arcticum]
MKRNLLLVGLYLLMTACGSDNTTNDTAASASSAAAAEAKNDDLENRGDIQHQMPDGDQIEEAYEAILEKAGVDDPELMEVYISFNKSNNDPAGDRAHMSVQMVSPENKNKIVAYSYDFQGKQVEDPREVTLSSGLGSKEKFIDTYDGFKEVLFKKSDITDFDKAEDVYKEAIAKSGYEPKDCYVDQLQFKYDNNGVPRGDVGVQSTRSISAHKGFSVDKEGNLTAD